MEPFLHSSNNQIIPNFLVYKFNVISTNKQTDKIWAVETHCFTSLFKNLLLFILRNGLPGNQLPLMSSFSFICSVIRIIGMNLALSFDGNGALLLTRRILQAELPEESMLCVTHWVRVFD